MDLSNLIELEGGDELYFDSRGRYIMKICLENEESIKTIYSHIKTLRDHEHRKKIEDEHWTTIGNDLDG